MALETLDKVFLLFNVIKEYFFWHVVAILIFILMLVILAWMAQSIGRRR